MTSFEHPRRRRGGQPGNRNAFVHGFYGRRLELDRKELAGAKLPPSDSLDDEIAMLRLSIRKLVERGVATQGLEEDLLMLRTLSLAVMALNRMVKTRYFLADRESFGRDIVHQALEQIRLENPGTILDDLEAQQGANQRERRDK